MINIWNGSHYKWIWCGEMRLHRNHSTMCFWMWLQTVTYRPCLLENTVSNRIQSTTPVYKCTMVSRSVGQPGLVVYSGPGVISVISVHGISWQCHVDPLFQHLQAVYLTFDPHKWTGYPQHALNTIVHSTVWTCLLAAALDRAYTYGWITQWAVKWQHTGYFRHSGWSLLVSSPRIPE
jgi:hypothetical protein